MEVLTEFNLDGLDAARDVVSVPTMGDNRVLTALIRAIGFTVADNYTDEAYDLEQKGRTGRQYVGDAVCVPLAAIFADMLTAVEGFSRKNASAIRATRGKTGSSCS